MKKFIISTDATSDIPAAFVQQHDIKICQLPVFMEGEQLDLDVITSEEFYAQLSEGKKSSTSQVNPDTAQEFLAEHLKEGDVLHISISERLSGTYNSFMQAQKNLAGKSEHKVLLVDTKASSMGQGLLVLYAAKLREQGMSIEEVKDAVEKAVQNTVLYFIFDDLEHVFRGGRISRKSLIVGSLLKIKPVLNCSVDGVIEPVKKVITRKKAKSTLANMVAEKYVQKFDQIFVGHASCKEEAEELADKVSALTGVDRANVITYELGFVIGSHGGPGTLVVCFGGKDREIAKFSLSSLLHKDGKEAKEEK